MRRLWIGDMETAKQVELSEAANHVAFVRAMRARPGGERADHLEVDGGTAAFTGVGSPLSQAFGLGLNGATEPAEIDRLFEFYLSRGAPVAVEVCNLADVSLANALISRGCRVDEHSHLLGRTLEGLASAGADDDVRPVGDADLEEWSEVVARGFTGGDVDAGLRELLRVFHAQDNSECFSAWRGGRMVGGGSLFFVGGIAILGGTSTMPEARGRGVQRDLLRLRLERAAARGARLAVVTTTPGSISQRNVLRAGFSILYARTRFVSDR